MSYSIEDNMVKLTCAVIQMNVSAVLCIFGFKCNYVYCPLSTVFWDSPLNAGNSVLQVFADSGWWQLVFVFFFVNTEETQMLENNSASSYFMVTS